MLLVLGLIAAIPSMAQLVKWGERIPRRANPPVLLVAGHFAVCPDPPSDRFYKLTFGKFDEVIARSGRVVLYFEPCYVANQPPIEGLAASLGNLIDRLMYEDGQPVTELDVVAHSMGGLIVRSYLAGKQLQDGSFAPPASPSIRKAVFIGTPHFGTAVASGFEADPQVREMSLGSPFLFDLATWNQGGDDLRGVDALSIIGTAGNNGEPGFTDSVVVLTSASLGFAAPDRTIVLPLCHTFGGIGALFLCPSALGLARVEDERHPTARAVLSFLNGTTEWMSTGQAAAQNPILSRAAALAAQLRTADDQPVVIQNASLTAAGKAPATLSISKAGIAFAEKLETGTAQISLNGYTQSVDLRGGGGQAFIVKPGPLISGVEPGPGPAWPLVLAPGMRVTIRGSRLSEGITQVTANGAAVPVIARAAEALDVVLPERIAGMVALTVKNQSGRHTIRIYVEKVNPVLFKTGRTAAAVHPATGQPVTSDAPAERNEVVSFFLTGLGDVAVRDGFSIALHQPDVTIGGAVCAVTYAGRAPGSPGVDQINCRVPAGASGMSEVIVTSGIRRSTALIPVQ
jgi:uncharacterized protein (TIGR03437 family)